MCHVAVWTGCWLVSVSDLYDATISSTDGRYSFEHLNCSRMYTAPASVRRRCAAEAYCVTPAECSLWNHGRRHRPTARQTRRTDWRTYRDVRGGQHENAATGGGATTTYDDVGTRDHNRSICAEQWQRPPPSTHIHQPSVTHTHTHTHTSRCRPRAALPPQTPPIQRVLAIFVRNNLRRQKNARTASEKQKSSVFSTGRRCLLRRPPV